MEDYDLDNKKASKPLMEKRRRERINNCLDQLKTLILEATKKDASRYTKLEKADILEMSVRHLRALQRQQMAVAMARDSNVITRYRAGFNQCAEEVVRYMSKIDGVNSDVRQRLLNHLANCMQNVNTTCTTSSAPPQTTRIQPYPLQVHIPTATHMSTLPGAQQVQPVVTSLPSQPLTPLAPPRLNGAFRVVPATPAPINPPVAFVLPQTPIRTDSIATSPSSISSQDMTSPSSSSDVTDSTSPGRSETSSCDSSLSDKKSDSDLNNNDNDDSAMWRPW